MAYVATVTPPVSVLDDLGRVNRVYVIAETGSKNTDEFEIKDVPKLFTITSYKATLTAGTGTTIQPKGGTATGWTVSTQEDLFLQSSAAAHINDNTPVRGYTSTGSIFIVSAPNNAATDHAITTEITIVEGHWP